MGFSSVTAVQTDLCNLNQLQQVFRVQQVKLQQVWRTLIIKVAEHSKTEKFFTEKKKNSCEKNKNVSFLDWKITF